MGVDHGGTGRTGPPEFGVEGTLMQIVSLRFCHIGTKKSVLWPSKYAKIRFWPGICPGPRWESWRRSPHPLVGCGRDIPPHTPPHAAPTHLRRSPCVPQNSSQIYAYATYSLYRQGLCYVTHLFTQYTSTPVYRIANSILQHLQTQLITLKCSVTRGDMVEKM